MEVFMRQAKREITDKARVLELLGTCEVGRLGTITTDGYPMIKPVNYVFREGCIYFHSAREGEKIDNIRRSDKVCFEADESLGYVRTGISPCSAVFRYRSVIVRGRASFVEDETERMGAFAALMKKYEPQGGYDTFLPEKLAITAIVRIEIEEITGKQEPPP
jgi:uncharacterized protein